MRPELERLKREADNSLSTRKGMSIEAVLWFGKGRYELKCGGRFPDVNKLGDAVDPGVDYTDIVGWDRGQGEASEPGTYTFDTDDETVAIPIIEPTAERLAEFGATIVGEGDELAVARESIQAVYHYEANYFSDWVMRPDDPEKGGTGTGGSRIERHPIEHHFTLLEAEPKLPSYFIVGRVDEDGRLELAALRLVEGVTIKLAANTVHTNDYVTGVLEEIYPRVWGIDEVLLRNRQRARVTLKPSVGMR